MMLDPAENEKWNSLERRVERLEEDMSDVKTSLRSIEGKVDRLVEGVAEIRGTITGIQRRLSQAPTRVQLLVALIPTWGAGAAIVAAVVRFTPK